VFVIVYIANNAGLLSYKLYFSLLQRPVVQRTTSCEG